MLILDDLGRRYGLPPSYWLDRSPFELMVDWMAAKAGEREGIRTWPLAAMIVRRR